MNPLLNKLQDYPFTRLRALLQQSSQQHASTEVINLSIGEPKHPAPKAALEAITSNLHLLGKYPPNHGSAELRQAIADWIAKRFGGAQLDPQAQIQPCSGSREALFSFAQTVVDSTLGDRYVVTVNPFYQIYEGAALLSNAEPWYVNADPAAGYRYDWKAVPPEVWERTDLIYVCSPGNPIGNLLDLDDWRTLFELSDQHDFIIASDECYSEIYFQEPPLGALEAAHRLGRRDFKNLACFSSLSKRSNLPGLRSGFVAGDAALMKKYLSYRSYHGASVSGITAEASIAAWRDEAHVDANRALYRRKFEAVYPILSEVMDVSMPSASFYLWPRTPVSDETFTLALYEQEQVIVLPGTYLSRNTPQGNPGTDHVRIALVAPLEECVEGARRIARLIKNL